MKCLVDPTHSEMMSWNNNTEYFCPASHFLDPETNKFQAMGVFVREYLENNEWVPRLRKVLWIGNPRPLPDPHIPATTAAMTLSVGQTAPTESPSVSTAAKMSSGTPSPTDGPSAGKVVIPRRQTTNGKTKTASGRGRTKRKAV